ncbi:hypothetical protein O185_01815 [Photorhabdus temperata J3]|uniref:Uncharacterized protein n=2 Tax=Photorhabdus temperata TaxID=574560 RepID=U7R469_PHOTE|nr:hypothetical protein O185_01815 [Photorhabdus temperata J3]
MAAFWLDKLKELYDFIGAGMDIIGVCSLCSGHGGLS